MSEERIKILEMLREGKITVEETMVLLKQVEGSAEGPKVGNQDEGRGGGFGEGRGGDSGEGRGGGCDNSWGNRWENNTDSGAAASQSGSSDADTDDCQGEGWYREQDGNDGKRRGGQDWSQWIPFRPDFGWINDLCSAIGETTRSIIYPDEFWLNTKKEKFYSASNVEGEIRSLIFEGKNSPVRLESYGGNIIDVEVNYRARGQMVPRFGFNEDNGVYTLSYDDKALHTLGITVRVPENVQIGSVRLKSKNGAVSVTGINSENIELNTKNEPIKVLDTKGKRLYCENKNASIVLNSVVMREIDAQTTNSKISLEDVDGFRARLVTGNAKIEVKDSYIAQLYSKTSNSSIRLDGLSRKQDEPFYSVDAITSNGQITIQLPREGPEYKLRASTTLGGIYGELSGLEYQVNEGNYVEAQTPGFGAAEEKLILNLQTTNGGIYILK